LTLNGTYLFIDRSVIEKLYDPLLHLLRNAFDHGIEPPELRCAQQKPEVGQIEICAFYQGRQVVIEVRDDGRGLDLERIRNRAIALGWLPPEQATTVSEAQLLEYVFEPGFSTATEVSELSGRGVGLDVVREQLQSLKGRVSIRSIPGEGATFVLTLPLTLTNANLVVCLIGSTPVALRSDGITEMLIPKAAQLKQVGSQRLLLWKDQEVPVFQLSDLLTYHCLVPDLPPNRILAAVPSPVGWETPMLLLKRGEQTVALQVDRLVTEQELVVKPFGAAIAPPSYVYGCTVLGDGTLVPVIDGLALLDVLVKQETLSAPQLSETEALAAAVQTNAASGQEPPRMVGDRSHTILVVDDAVTSRRTLMLSLERAGYQVLEARDGQEALDQLQQNVSIQLVVCDIEMPNMNGFEFLTQRRQDAALAKIPTVMLTSRSNDKHRWLAMQLGATDYFTKPYLEQEFLGAIGALIQ
jgi:chemotaxis family two-component system sensor histidine kinase/response regulator PixL